MSASPTAQAMRAMKALHRDRRLGMANFGDATLSELLLNGWAVASGLHLCNATIRLTALGEELVAADRRRRQRETAAMTRCACGNIAVLGRTECGRCEDDRATPSIEDRLARIEAHLGLD